MSLINHRFGDQATLARQLLDVRQALDRIATCNEHVRFCFSPFPDGWKGQRAKAPCTQHDGSWTPTQPYFSARMYELLGEAKRLRRTLQEQIDLELDGPAL